MAIKKNAIKKSLVKTPSAQRRLTPLTANPTNVLALRRVLADPQRATPADLLALQQTVGNRATQQTLTPTVQRMTPPANSHLGSPVIQLSPLVSDRLNVVGERHVQSEPQRGKEKRYCAQYAGVSQYWTEAEFLTLAGPGGRKRERADPFALRWDHSQALMLKNVQTFQNVPNLAVNLDRGDVVDQRRWVNNLKAHWQNLKDNNDGLNLPKDDARRSPKMLEALKKVEAALTKAIETFPNKDTMTGYYQAVLYLNFLHPLDRSPEQISEDRSEAMHTTAESQATVKGVWKIGEKHREDIATNPQLHPTYNLVSRQDFMDDLNKFKDSDCAIS